MQPNEFVLWLKGFVAGSNSYNLTPKGWEEVKEKLESVVTDVPTLNYWQYSNNTFEQSDKKVLHD